MNIDEEIIDKIKNGWMKLKHLEGLLEVCVIVIDPLGYKKKL